MIFTVLDTETTGFRKKFGPLIQEGQGRVCQLAMLMCDETGRELIQFSSLLRPHGWEVGEGARAIHGHSTEDCLRFGVASVAGYSLFLRLVSLSDFVVAHNAEFDAGMMEVEAAYHGSSWPDVEWRCTKDLTTHICALPPTEKMIRAGRDHYKSPNLDEALQKLCGRAMGDSGHDAMNDARACKDIFLELIRQGKCGGPARAAA